LLNLIRDAWIPVRRQSGAREKMRPADLAHAFADDPIVDIAWPRADFRAAALEFLIGLLATACRPSGDSAWRRWQKTPPKPEELAARFALFETAFNFDGPGPRFLQDGGDMGDELSPISGLLIEQPGANTQKNNADLFVKRGRVEILGRSTAAMALYTLQTFAPAGGAGHRTGLRGGGPLTTLAYSPATPTLWNFLWLNVTSVFDPLDDEAPEDRLQDVFPWLAPTRVSDKTGAATVLEQIHPAQCFWAMPRRIALDLEPNIDKLPCDLTGEVEDVIVRRYRTRPYGVNYQSIPHPLTPAYKTKEEWLPVHPQPGGIAYRHWCGLVLDGKTARPAACITAAERRLQVTQDRATLRLYGYDMDNMKARGFVETEMPLLFPPPEAEEPFRILVENLVEGAKAAASLTIGAIKMARGKEGGGGLDLVREKFFAETQSAFFATIEQGLSVLAADPDALCHDVKKAWLDAALAPLVRQTFDLEAPLMALADSGDLAALETAVNARRMLEIALAGYGKGGGELFKALGLPVPAQKPKKGGSK
jgi:CRISPR system Cascade subunit CasA